MDKLVDPIEQLMHQPSVTQCWNCKAKLDIKDIISSPAFKIVGVSFEQLLRLVVFYRTWNLDWPPSAKVENPQHLHPNTAL